jgi:hypothetical protein
LLEVAAGDVGLDYLGQRDETAEQIPGSEQVRQKIDFEFRLSRPIRLPIRGPGL